jgi:ketosteroid isomerase-like protein
MRPVRLALLALAALACTPPRIPDTTIPDTPDTRAVLKVVETYAGALQQRDAAALLALVAPTYFDDAGTTDPSDDLDYQGLAAALPGDLARLQGLRVEIVVRNLEVAGDTATAEVFSDTWYQVAVKDGTVPRRDTDVHRMRFVRVQGNWRIASGL